MSNLVHSWNCILWLAWLFWKCRTNNRS